MALLSSFYCSTPVFLCDEDLQSEECDAYNLSNVLLTMEAAWHRAKVNKQEESLAEPQTNTSSDVPEEGAMDTETGSVDMADMSSDEQEMQDVRTPPTSPKKHQQTSNVGAEDIQVAEPSAKETKVSSGAPESNTGVKSLIGADKTPKKLKLSKQIDTEGLTKMSSGATTSSNANKSFENSIKVEEARKKSKFFERIDKLALFLKRDQIPIRIPENPPFQFPLKDTYEYLRVKHPEQCKRLTDIIPIVKSGGNKPMFIGGKSGAPSQNQTRRPPRKGDLNETSGPA